MKPHACHHQEMAFTHTRMAYSAERLYVLEIEAMRCRRWGHSSVHWRRNCSADHTATQTIGHSSIDITAV